MDYVERTGSDKRHSAGFAPSDHVVTTKCGLMFQRNRGVRTGASIVTLITCRNCVRVLRAQGWRV